MRWLAVFAVGFAGCAASDDPVEHFVVPFDGQTAVALDAPLRVQAADLEVPPDYPVGELVSVVDLLDGGFVAGSLSNDAADLLFTPDRGWRQDRRYAWTVRVPDDVPHGPHFSAPEDVLVSSVFDTTDRVDVLAAGLTPSGTPCVILSEAPAGDFVPDRVTLDDVDVEDAVFSPYAFDEWDPSVDVPGLETTADVVCVQSSAEVVAGTRLRLWVDGSGPQLVEVQDRTPRALLVDLHRGGS